MARRGLGERGVLRLQSSAANAQRGANRHIGASPISVGGVPGMVARLAALSCSRVGIERSSASVYRCLGSRNSTAVSACSTTWPPYITATRSVCPAITPMSCVISSTPMDSRNRRSSMSARICAWIDTSSAVVGSSAMSSFGLADQADRDHRALPHAAGQLVRVVIEPLGGPWHADQAEHLDGPLRSRPGAMPPAWIR